jgi:hypothetical protein
MGLPMSDPSASDTSDDDWRRDLRVKLVWAFVVKLALLALLWFVCFRGSPS